MFTGRIKTSIQLLRTAAFSATLAVLLLAFAFIFLDFSLFYVWQHSSAELPVFYRLAAILVGQEGTYLIWAWLSIIVVLLYTELHGIHDRTAMITNVYALICCAFLLVMTITMTPFRSIFAVSGASMPTSGNSISPELIDILMPLHIFTTFIAYAFTIIPAAMSLAYLTKKKNMPDSKNYLRIAWLFLSICIIVGAIWADRLLGWNGFWQWDPIQALSLCTWLLLTAALHAVVRLNVGEYNRLFPLLCIGTFLGSLYMTLLARSDVFGSIHSFPGTPTWWMIVVFMAIVIVFSLIMALRPDKTEYTTSDSIYIFKPSNTFYFTILILIMMAFIAFWGPTVYLILGYMGREIIIPMEFYNILFYPLVVVLSYLTGICLLYGRVRSRTLAYVGIIYFTISIILAVAVPYGTHSVAASYTGSSFEKILGSISVTSYIPAFFFVTGSVIFKMVRDLKVNNKTALIHLNGINLIHVGFVFIVLGAILSTSFATSHHFSYSLSEKGEYKEDEGIVLRFLDYRVEKIGSDWYQTVDVEIFDDSEYKASPVFLKSRQFGYITRPEVRHGLLSDTQIEFHGTLPHQIELETIEINIKKQPFAIFMWSGCVLLIVGVLLTLSSDVIRRKGWILSYLKFVMSKPVSDILPFETKECKILTLSIPVAVIIGTVIAIFVYEMLGYLYAFYVILGGAVIVSVITYLLKFRKS
ncbi:MAG: cytochrome c biogenesis protein CcsA [ANME-2 cluster archaeon]|nr:cytochrome c biogenesis protein CcsA [ANME-2 cluster archaeon]MBC2701687.1 cytochrome c biogenesis protein CcsA [ANME-2 cluster archaeon]MBC2709188.1 cytochrome c biogenesis protein CcsA [ANME-2 cluster archaeon]MBC2745941.1 cytochrome c biogenesis protein CcsA [ANME-2 cluster archaeon]